MDTNTILLLISIIGCFVGLGGWLSSHEKKIGEDSEWRGIISGKLDAMLGIGQRVDKLEDKIDEHSRDIAVVAQSAKSAHHRLDEHMRKE